MARPTGPSVGTSVGAPSDGVARAAAQASGRRQHPTDAARQSTLDHRPIGPLAKKYACSPYSDSITCPSLCDLIYDIFTFVQLLSKKKVGRFPRVG